MKKRYGAAIRNARRKKRLSPNELADLCDVSAIQLTHLEKNFIKNVPECALNAVLDALGLSHH